MKKTLTVNLGGTVFHIDEDAYHLLDKYLANLKVHFRKEVGAEEIVKDMELRISELFTEKVNSGVQVITVEYVEEVIKRMGKPEELSDEEVKEEKVSGEPRQEPYSSGESDQTRRRFYRNPDDKILGGLASGLAAYMGWDPTLVRLLLIVLVFFGVGVVIPIYIVCWIVVPEAHTAAEKLAMRGEKVTVENIGKTVTDGFEKVAGGVNDYVNSGKPRTALQKLGDAFVQVVGVFIKVLLVLLAIVFCPVLFVLIIVLFALIIAAFSIVLGGGAAFISWLPFINDWNLISTSPVNIVLACITGIALVGIPLAGLVFSIFRKLLDWKPMSPTVKTILVILWVISLIASIILFPIIGIPYWNHHIYTITI
jgi:Putative stress-responsive transcriptional regulator